METETITLELSKNYLMFAEYYAKKYGISITEMFVDYLKTLEKIEQKSYYPSLEKITGFISENIDAEKVYQDYLTEKYNP
ncbi:DUF6364 family protein [Geminocystis herdmanii]|uniref:DUF6364 family protein n=1 Tax=Geminocystis herdmanii TaxID=669359 RepID=UPI000346A1BE|nr:DUF6364 family protein [Geminocystis herdmanii]